MRPYSPLATLLAAALIREAGHEVSLFDATFAPGVQAFEEELGVHAGDTTADGEFTLRTIECAGGCGWGTVVSVDHRYREPVKPENVPAIVEELRNGSE